MLLLQRMQSISKVDHCQSHELIFSYAGVAVIDRPKFFLPQKRLMEKSEMYPESDRTEDKQLLGESADIQLIDSIGVAWFGSKMDTKIRFQIEYKKKLRCQISKFSSIFLISLGMMQKQNFNISSGQKNTFANKIHKIFVKIDSSFQKSGNCGFDRCVPTLQTVR